MLVNPVLQRLKQGNLRLKDSLGYKVRSHLKQKEIRQSVIKQVGGLGEAEVS